MTVQSDIAAAKEVTRELHEAIQGAREAQRSLEAAWAKVRDDIEAKIEAEVTSEMVTMGDRIAEATEEARKKINQQFDKLADALLGESPRQRRSGTTPLFQLAGDAKLPAAVRKRVEKVKEEL